MENVLMEEFNEFSELFDRNFSLDKNIISSVDGSNDTSGYSNIFYLCCVAFIGLIIFLIYRYYKKYKINGNKNESDCLGGFCTLNNYNE